MKKWILLTCFMTLLSGQAMAGFLLEPYMGTIVNSTTEDDEAVTGTGMGARVGMQTLGLMYGLDYQMLSPSIEDSDYEYAANNYGLFVGYEFPIMLRLWGTFVLGGEYTGEDGDTTFAYATTGTKIGIGYKVIPFVSINFESMSYTFADGEIKSGGVKADLEDTNAQMYLLSVSFPISL